MVLMNKRCSPKNILTAVGLALLISTGLGTSVLTNPSRAELELSFYSGVNTSPHSVVDYDFNLGAGRQSTTVKWDGEPFVMPPYFGLRATWWLESYPGWGIALDNSHSKVAANPLPAGFEKLEFTDGINIYTLNLQYRFKNSSRFTPYLGIGAGFTTPHVEVANTAITSKTFEYQFGGPAILGLVGVSTEINKNWSVFTEFKSAYVKINADLQNGGWLETDIISNQFIVGVSYKF